MTGRPQFCDGCNSDPWLTKVKRKNLHTLTSPNILAHVIPASWGCWLQHNDIKPPAGIMTHQACWQKWPAARLSPSCKRGEIRLKWEHFSKCVLPVRKNKSYLDLNYLCWLSKERYILLIISFIQITGWIRLFTFFDIWNHWRICLKTNHFYTHN